MTRPTKSSSDDSEGAGRFARQTYLLLVLKLYMKETTCKGHAWRIAPPSVQRGIPPPRPPSPRALSDLDQRLTTKNTNLMYGRIIPPPSSSQVTTLPYWYLLLNVMLRGETTTRTFYYFTCVNYVP